MRLPYIPPNELLQNREKVCTLLPTESMMIILGQTVCYRNADVEFIFRQESDFWYVTGIDQPDCGYVVYKSKAGAIEEFVVIPDFDVTTALWSGAQLLPKEAADISGMSTVYTTSQFKEKLGDVVTHSSNILWEQTPVDLPLAAIIKEVATFHHKDISSPSLYTKQVRIIKSPWELQQLEQAAQVNIAAHKRGIKYGFLNKHRNEYHLEAEILHEYGLSGLTWSYPPIVASGNNATTLHYSANNQPIQNGDLVLIDAGCEYNYYASDITRTFPVNGTFTDAQKVLYEIVFNAQERALAHISDYATTPVTLQSIHKVVVTSITQELCNLGILSGSVEANLTNHTYAAYYPHATSHWLGLDVHDKGGYKNNSGDPLQLTSGMVFTLEPGIYIPQHDQNVAAEFRGIGIRLEDDIALVDNQIKNLTALLPRTISEIETLITSSL